MAEERRPRLVAVVDDNVLNRLLIRMALECGFDALSVVEGADGRDAIAIRFVEPPPDLMIVNGHMPGMDGHEAIGEIRRLEAERGLEPVHIAISSAGQWWLDAGLAAGADEAIMLPLNRVEVAAVVSRALGVAPLATPRRPVDALPPRARLRLPMPVPRFPMEIRVDAAPDPRGRRAGADEDGHRWVAVPTYGSSSRSLRTTFGFDCPVYEARHAEVWEAEAGGRRTCSHRSQVVEPA